MKLIAFILFHFICAVVHTPEITSSNKMKRTNVRYGRRFKNKTIRISIDDLNVCSMSSWTIRNVVLNRFVHSVVS